MACVICRDSFDRCVVQLGLSGVPVATGTDGGSAKHVDTFSDTAGSYMPRDDARAFPEATK